MTWTGYQYEETDPDGWTTFWRLDPRGQDFQLSDWFGDPDRPGHRLWIRAATPAGVRGRWHTTASVLTLDVRADLGIYNAIAPVDILVNNTLHSRHPLEPGEQQLHITLPNRAQEAKASPQEVEIWLPQGGVVSIRGPVFSGEAEGVPVDGPRWVAYGSSISQCTGAYGPSETWPALVARRFGWDLMGMGFAGECHLDPIVARTIRDTPADLISLCLGINVYGGATFSGRTLPSAVESFIATIRAGHPTTPITVVTPLLAPNREGKPNEVGLTLDDVRTCVELGARTDPAIHVIDGRQILTTGEAQALYVDDLHPGPDGYRLIAERLAPRLDPR
jgi:hypothetical protein